MLSAVACTTIVLLLERNMGRHCPLLQFQKDDNGKVEAGKIQGMAETYGLQALLPKAVATSNVLVSSSSPAVGLTCHAACLAQALLTWHTYII